MPRPIETLARWMCARDNVDPDQFVKTTSAGEEVPVWRLYAPSAEWFLIMLVRQASD